MCHDFKYNLIVYCVWPATQLLVPSFDWKAVHCKQHTKTKVFLSEKVLDTTGYTNENKVLNNLKIIEHGKGSNKC